ncbi:hypothetical protein [Novosphingobium sp. PhB165]|uniref:hypothetical protein n=1 Tax=Novosphingobium sp. PhB165 TaxID=2485105 RepID=UPI001FB3A097|nr:hypothetical protein [Novosphingobium sp. PhB165]
MSSLVSLKVLTRISLQAALDIRHGVEALLQDFGGASARSPETPIPAEFRRLIGEPLLTRRPATSPGFWPDAARGALGMMLSPRPCHLPRPPLNANAAIVSAFQRDEPAQVQQSQLQKCTCLLIDPPPMREESVLEYRTD